MDRSELDMLNRIFAFGNLMRETEMAYVPATEADIGNAAVIKIECPTCKRSAIWVRKEAV